MVGFVSIIFLLGELNNDHMKSSKIKSGNRAALWPTVAGITDHWAAAGITTPMAKPTGMSRLRTEPGWDRRQIPTGNARVGMAKPARNLSESLQTKFGYDVGKADALKPKPSRPRRPIGECVLLAPLDSIGTGELRRSLVGDNYSSAVSISVEADGKVSVQDQVQSYGYAWTSGITSDTGFQPIAPYTQFTPYAPYGQHAAFPPYAPYARFAPYSMPNGYRPPLTPTWILRSSQSLPR